MNPRPASRIPWTRDRRAVTPTIAASGAGPSPIRAFGVSGHSEQQVSSRPRAVAWTETGPFVAQGTNAGNNDELVSFHPGGINV